MLVPAVEHQSFLPHPTPADAPDLGIERQPWMADANCRGKTDLFFPEGRGQGASRAYAAAKLICAACPVRGECLDYVLATSNSSHCGDFGYWAGTTPRQRRAMRRVGIATVAA